MSDLGTTWQDAKTRFERATGKKKPSEKLLGFFSKGTGVAAALKAVDKSWAKLPKLTKATATFEKAAKSYRKTLKASMEGNDKRIAGIKDLGITLDLLSGQCAARLEELSGEGADERKAEFEAAVKKIIAKKLKNTKTLTKDKAATEAFRAHLAKAYSAYHLDFVTDCQRKRDKLEIYQEYIAANAANQVNVDHKALSAAASQVDGEDVSNLKLKPVYIKVLRLLDQDPLPRFRRSDEAKELCGAKLKKRFGVD